MSKCRLIIFSDLHYLDKRPKVLNDALRRKLTQFSIPIIDALIKNINEYKPNTCIV